MPTPAQVQFRVDALTNVGKLVHLAMRYDSVMVDRIAATLFDKMRQHYVDAVSSMARSVGCRKTAHLSDSPELEQLRQNARAHAESIANTYNFDLTFAIETVRRESPRANRFTYSSRLATWEQTRAAWKDAQIALMTYQFATQLGKEHFMEHNAGIVNTEGAILVPRRAAEANCQALIDAGVHPVDVIRQIPMPLHYNCVHQWRIVKGDTPDCNQIWVGA